MGLLPRDEAWLRDALLKDELLELFRRDFARYPSRAAWASAHDVPVRMVGMCLDGKRPVTGSIAAALGFVELMVYRPVTRAAREAVR